MSIVAPAALAARFNRPFRVVALLFLAFALIAGTSSRASASWDDSVEEIFEATDLATAVTEHMQWYWDEVFYISDINAETPYAVLYDIYSYGQTGCGEVSSYGYSWYCVADDTVYISVDHVQDMREQEGDLYAAVMGVGQPMSMAVLDRIGALAFDRNGNADIYSQEASACLTGVWTNELWYADIINEYDVLSAARGLSTIGSSLPDAYLYGFETEDPQTCIDAMIP
jgi:predicted metalloprotease